MDEYEEAINFFFGYMLWPKYIESKNGDLVYASIDNFDSVEAVDRDMAVISKRGIGIGELYSKLVVEKEHVKSTLDYIINNGVRNKERVIEILNSLEETLKYLS